MLTLDGYVLKTPPSPFTYPQTSPNSPTTPVNKDYLPPKPATPPRQPQPQPQPQPRPQPQQPQPRPQPQPQPQPRPQVPAPTAQAPSTGPQYLPPAPQPTQPARPQYQPPAPQPTQQQPARPQYQPPAPQPTQQQPARPQYQPPAPQPTQQQPKPQYLPPAPQPSPQAPVRQPPQPPRRIPSTSPPKYLPPVQPNQPKYSGDRDVQSSNQQKQVYQQKPIRGEDQLSPQIFPPAKYTPSQSQEQSVGSPAKCASALVCTAENYCSSIGVISETPVEITPFRVPLTDCVIEGTGAPGKCCRDPNYVDPWPVNLAGVCATRNKVI